MRVEKFQEAGGCGKDLGVFGWWVEGLLGNGFLGKIGVGAVDVFADGRVDGRRDYYVKFGVVIRDCVDIAVSGVATISPVNLISSFGT